ncbi:TFIIB-type zinc ribbon-containing protein [Mangrovicoccus algicola]|uniref:TFIIB-type zinc ribbon-containing protein n=1 Tax=Mangrovicoccus algicola TaxID=2771008 RepID=A0A8J6YZ77_9RHOB|nr:TFIIB-type zinc ribbon-containing protein [Mangrovicoccus algicola]MBE3639379.1 TFIIB-type zinc ribbon-containing protein [Mangrovicoccus algicola]
MIGTSDTAQDGAGQGFPCPACGAPMQFDPGRGVLACGHCGHVAEIDDRNGPWGAPRAIRELDFRAALENQLDAAEMEETRVLQCSGCGAEVEFRPGIHAGECPFCATPVVGDPAPSRHIRPRALVPFALGEAEARAAMTRWLGRLWFAPSGLQQYARRGRRMEGIYLPYWTFDARTRSSYSGQRGKVYFESRRRNDGSIEQVARVRWHPARGRVSRDFDDVLVPGSRSLPGEMIAGLTPWDLSRLEPYKPEYLAGLRAEAYGVALDEAYHGARAQMDQVIARDVRFDIGGDRQRIHAIDTQISDVTFKHVLLPVWVGVYRYRGQAFRILVNAQSGRVQGARPWSMWKIAAAILAGAVLAGALGYAMALQQGAI